VKVLAKPWRLARNVWLLRRDLAVWLLNRVAAKGSKPIAIRCVRCGHELTKPCKPGSPCHVFKWPEGPEGTTINGKFVRIRAGTLVYVRRQRARGGELRPDYDIRLKPF
jgi:hypothetical protein